MAYEAALAGRIRELVEGQSHLEEKKMFVGLAFLLGGNIGDCSKRPGWRARSGGPAESDKLIATTNAEAFEMRGRTMKGWLRVAPEFVRTKQQLAKWVEVGTTYARSLPPK